MWRILEKMTECARSAVMLDGKMLDILQGVAQGCTVSPDLFKEYINDVIAVSYTHLTLPTKA